MSAAIELEGLRKVYPGGAVALDGVTLTIGESEIFGFLGRNGAGKTTTIRILATLTRPTSGTASVAGHRVDREPGAIRAMVGLAMQQTALDELMTAREHLDLIGRLAGMARAEARARSDELLDAFGLRDSADRVVVTFSGGMRRRLDIAMALVHRPSILFLDEPTAGLDPQSRRAMWRLIEDLRAGGSTVFLTTQYLEEADELADRIAVIDAGRIVALGTPAELKAAHAREVGPAVRRRAPEGPSLEDVFVRLTGDRIDDGAGSDAAVGVAIAKRFRGSPIGTSS